MERRVRTANKKRESRHILGGRGGNMNPRDVKFQGVFRGRGANESGGEGEGSLGSLCQLSPGGRAGFSLEI
jgi:hypothetical protein